ncbi:capsid protein [Fastidiosipila sanguinis]|uniref:Capsid protein n=1 Tax=Fastidiosipila sanguinis TaxID=236753 RepID=A0A2S0KP94_9FIRM|nr:capsid protein [Fastidiosipila sanguinis]AVM42828.1 capsid protein [Fastidiosipila sanguinis]
MSENKFNYVEQFVPQLEQKYAQELVSTDLTSKGITFIGTNTVRIPRVKVGGYGEHSRNGGFNRKNISNDWEVKKLTHDRDVEFFVDTMDVDETNQVVSAANITNTFEEEHAIPELDAYNFSKIFSEYTTTFSKTADTTALTAQNVLAEFDKFMEEMDDAGVPQSGRILYVTAAVHTLLKNAEAVSRTIVVNGSNDNQINRSVRSLDEVTIKTVPSDRFKTVYDFTDGYKPASAAKQINMILVHPSAVISLVKHSYINLWTPGSHTQGDGYLYQNRRYNDLFLIENKLDGVKINVQA